MHERDHSYERQVRPEATLDDLDLELAAAFLATTPAGERGSTIQALHGYGLMEPEGEGWRITNAALLLFGREPADRWHPRAGIGAFRVTGTRRVPGRAGNVNRAGRADPPLARAIEEIRPIVRAHIRRSDPLRDIFFRDLPLPACARRWSTRSRTGTTRSGTGRPRSGSSTTAWRSRARANSSNPLRSRR